MKTPRERKPKAQRDWQALTAADLSKKQARRAQLIGGKIVSMNIVIRIYIWYNRLMENGRRFL